MIEDTNPFVEPEAKDKPGAGSTKLAWIVAGFATVLLIGALAVWYSASAKARTLRSDLDRANTALTNALAESKRATDQISALESKMADLEKEKESVGQKAKGLEDELRSDLESKDVTISKLQGKLTVTILDRVMFDSGEAILKPDGEAVLQKVAVILEEHPEIKIHVIGHTDNVPIHTKFASNWELSTARALAAVHFLTERAGVDPHKVGAVGYGEYRPIADNSTEEGKAKNRRIAITILSDELVGADTVPAAEPDPSLDSPLQPAKPVVSEPKD